MAPIVLLDEVATNLQSLKKGGKKGRQDKHIDTYFSSVRLYTNSVHHKSGV